MATARPSAVRACKRRLRRAAVLDFLASPWPGETARALRRGAIARTVPPAR